MHSLGRPDGYALLTPFKPAAQPQTELQAHGPTPCQRQQPPLSTPGRRPLSSSGFVAKTRKTPGSKHGALDSNLPLTQWLVQPSLTNKNRSHFGPPELRFFNCNLTGSRWRDGRSQRPRPVFIGLIPIIPPLPLQAPV